MASLFPGSVPGDNYVWIFDGTVTIEKAGIYTFCSRSQDGSYIFINDNVVVNNGGIHPTRRICQAATMTAGSHRMRVAGFAVKPAQPVLCGSLVIRGPKLLLLEFCHIMPRVYGLTKRSAARAQGDGQGGNQVATYAGPDTDGRYDLISSSTAPAAVPPPPVSQWRVTVFDRSPVHLVRSDPASPGSSHLTGDGCCRVGTKTSTSEI
jgi:hypothetical protein